MKNKRHVKLFEKELDKAFKELQKVIMKSGPARNHSNLEAQIRAMATVVSHLNDASFEYCSQTIYLANRDSTRFSSSMFQNNNAKKLLDKYLNKAYRYLNRINKHLDDSPSSLTLSSNTSVRLHSKYDAHALPTHHIVKPLRIGEIQDFSHSVGKAYLDDGNIKFGSNDDHRIVKLKHRLTSLHIDKAKLTSLIAMTKITIAQLENVVSSNHSHELNSIQQIQCRIEKERNHLVEYQAELETYDGTIAKAEQDFSTLTLAVIEEKCHVANKTSELKSSLDAISEQVLSRYSDIKVVKDKDAKSNRLVAQVGMG